MLSFKDWADAWGVPKEAIDDLLSRLTVSYDMTETTGEAEAQNQIRLEAPKHNARIWRNNVGACTDNTGRFIRYGLANDSKRMNKHIKSSDLIGITTNDAGYGIFTAIEVKRPGWKYRGTAREQAQARWLTLVNTMGGIGVFATGPEGVWK